MTTPNVNADRLPTLCDVNHVNWLIGDDLEVTLDRVTGLYSATRLTWDDDTQDWTCGEKYGPAEALRLACEHQLIITS